MTDRELDDIIYEALVVLNTPEYLELPDEPFPTSEKFERRMAALLAGPKGYVRKWKRAARPLWRKVLSTAAAVLVVLSVSLGGVVAVSPTARAWVERVVVEWLEEYVGIHFQGETKEGGGVWRPTWLPSDIHETYVDDWDDRYGSVTYEDNDGEEIFFDYRPVEEGNQFNIDSEHMQTEEVTINGQKAQFFYSEIPGKNNYIIWLNRDESTAFMLVWGQRQEDMFKVAESVECIPK